jgi:hypothetical protein
MQRLKLRIKASTIALTLSLGLSLVSANGAAASPSGCASFLKSYSYPVLVRGSCEFGSGYTQLFNVYYVNVNGQNAYGSGIAGPAFEGSSVYRAEGTLIQPVSSYPPRMQCWSSSWNYVGYCL